MVGSQKKNNLESVQHLSPFNHFHKRNAFITKKYEYPRLNPTQENTNTITSTTRPTMNNHTTVKNKQYLHIYIHLRQFRLSTEQLFSIE